MNQRIPRLICSSLFLTLLINLSACSTSKAPAVKPKIVPPSSAEASQPSSRLPFNIKVTDDLNDGDTLFVRTKIDALNAWDRGDVYLQVKGFANGEMQEQLLVPLATAIAEQHPEATTKYISKRFKNLFLIFSIPSEDLTDYQLELIWGKEATASLTAAPELDAVVIKNFNVYKQKDCENCPQISILKATLENRAEQAVTAVTLEVGFELFDAKKQKSSKQSIAKQIIEINDLILPPGTDQDLEFELTNQQSSQKGLVPIVLILNYQLKSE